MAELIEALALLFFILNVAIVIGVAWWSHRRMEHAWPYLYWIALFIKVCAGLFIGWLYTGYYSSADTFRLFSDATVLADLARTDVVAFAQLLLNGDQESYMAIGMTTSEPRSVFFIKVLSVVSVLTNDSYWITSIHLSLVSFLSAFYLVRVLNKYFPSSRPAFVIALLFFPSCVLWSSGIIKESIGIMSLYMVSAMIVQWWKGDFKPLWQITIFGIAMAVLWKIRYFYVGILLPCVFAVFCVKFLSKKFKFDLLREIIAVVVFLLVFGWLGTHLHPNFALDRILTVIVENHDDYIRISSSDDVIIYQDLLPTWSSVMWNAPHAFFSGLFRPFLWEAGNILQFLSGLENMIILILTALVVSRLRTIATATNRLLIVTVLIYVVLLCIFLALSTPNFGSLVRYRMGFLPFYLILILDQAWIKQSFNKIESWLVNHLPTLGR